jgi:hypothetical protein
LLPGEASFASVAAAVCVVHSQEVDWRRSGSFPFIFVLLYVVRTFFGFVGNHDFFKKIDMGWSDLLVSDAMAMMAADNCRG